MAKQGYAAELEELDNEEDEEDEACTLCHVMLASERPLAPVRPFCVLDVVESILCQEDEDAEVSLSDDELMTLLHDIQERDTSASCQAWQARILDATDPGAWQRKFRCCSWRVTSGPSSSFGSWTDLTKAPSLH